MLISYNMWSSNHFPYPAVSHVFQGPDFTGSGSRVRVQGPGSGSKVQGPGSGSRVQDPGSGSGSRVQVQVLEVAIE